MISGGWILKIDTATINLKNEKDRKNVNIWNFKKKGTEKFIHPFIVQMDVVHIKASRLGYR